MLERCLENIFILFMVVYSLEESILDVAFESSRPSRIMDKLAKKKRVRIKPYCMFFIFCYASPKFEIKKKNWEGWSELKNNNIDRA